MVIWLTFGFSISMSKLITKKLKVSLFVYNITLICIQAHFVFYSILNELEQIIIEKVVSSLVNMDKLLWTNEFTNQVQ
jgi:hypothetical protein